jgi:hypothetical protein
MDAFPHLRHALDGPGLEIRVGVDALVPTLAVDRLHIVAGQIDHAAVPEGSNVNPNKAGRHNVGAHG